VDLRVEPLTTSSTVAAITEEWRELHEASGDVNPFSGPDWSVAWLEHFATDGRFEPFVLAVRDGEGRLVGVAPLYQQHPIRGVATIIQPIGTGGPWIGPFELPEMAAMPELGRDVSRAVVGFLCESPDRWDWVNLTFPQSAPWFEPEWLANWSFTIQVRHSRATVVLDLERGGNIYAGRRNLKESFRRARNRLTRDFGAEGWSTRRITDAADIPAAFNRLSDLHGQRAELENGQPVHPDVVQDRAVRKYFGDVVQRLAAHGRVSIYELCVNDEVMASQLILHTATGSYSSISGAAEKIWPYSAVTYLQSQAVADAQEAGHERMCLSLGPNQAKLRWTNKVEIHTEFGLVGPRRRSQLLYLAAGTRDTITNYRAARRAHRI
jgi:CelD/BcsL family acetyltransferase involved in cellulose biosynthesis